MNHDGAEPDSVKSADAGVLGHEPGRSGFDCFCRVSEILADAHPPGFKREAALRRFPRLTVLATGPIHRY
jgi:hypothetical protein